MDPAAPATRPTARDAADRTGCVTAEAADMARPAAVPTALAEVVSAWTTGPTGATMPTARLATLATTRDIGPAARLTVSLAGPVTREIAPPTALKLRLTVSAIGRVSRLTKLPA
jgi:hypothetical protein